MQDQLLGDRYRLLRPLGEGGMGQVWEARDETLGRPVAVKVISRLAGGGSRGDQARRRFLREARITARLQHPNIVTVHDLGETGTGDERAPFLVMEIVRGEGLDSMLGRGAVALPDAARWGAQICEALTEAHDAGILHRDIKPSNIFVTPSGTVKVLDFGIARAAGPLPTVDRLTATGLIVGSPAYMAPEQARGLPEPGSDLYALGCLLYELITGRLPFQAPDALGHLSAHLTQEPLPPSSLAAGIPPAWDSLVLRLLHKDPAQRYATAADLSRALRQVGQGPLGPFHIWTFADKVLDVWNSPEDGVPIIQHSCHGGPNQQLTLQPLGQGLFEIGTFAGKCLEVFDASTEDGARIVQNSRHGGPNQRFTLRSLGQELFEIGTFAGKVLDVWNSPEDGVPIIQHSCHGGPNQRFRLVLVGSENLLERPGVW
ncbi:serine/threonine protein kinase [Streptomyces sp. NPDC048018]|uniref:serine/threonine protein kinase n=1 Tax=Streptomyces sp. NPDC048018 TaxID=3365499 RepID=UPI0037223A5D